MQKFQGSTIAGGERVMIGGSSSTYVVWWHADGHAIEVRCELAPGRKELGPVPPPASEGGRGRCTWREGQNITVTARCAINSALRQRSDRAKQSST